MIELFIYEKITCSQSQLVKFVSLLGAIGST